MDESTVTLLRFVKSYIEASGWIFDTVSVFWNLMYPWNCMFVGYWLSPAFWQSCAWKPLDFFRFLKTIYKMNLMFYSVWPEIRYGAHKLIRPLLTEVRAEGCFHSGKFYWKSWCDPCFDCVGFSFFKKKNHRYYFNRIFFSYTVTTKWMWDFTWPAVSYLNVGYIFFLFLQRSEKTYFARALHNSGFWFRWVVKVYTLTIKWLG